MPEPHLPEDPDVDLHEPSQRTELRHPAPVLLAIAAGGALGAGARYGLGVAFPTQMGGLPLTTWGINVAGCLLLGVLMVLVTDVFPHRRLLRPFAGVGLLGGFTTFSTYVVETSRLMQVGRAGLALAYLFGTVATAVPAAWLGLTVARAVLGRRRGRLAPEAGG